MVSKSFDINASSMPPFDSSSKKLLVELSSESVTFILVNRASGNPEAVESFLGSHSKTADWETMQQQSHLLALTNLETVVIIAYPNMLPIPAGMYAPEQASAQLELFFGPATSLFTSGDVIKEAEMVVAWQISLEEHEFLVNHFQWLQMKHVATIAIENYQQVANADGQVFIYGNTAWLMLWNNAAFMVARPVVFTKADDLSWYLLDTCRQFNLPPDGIAWQVAGMIEEGSSLWQALVRFVDPVSAMESSKQLEGLPAHYFAHLLKTVEN